MAELFLVILILFLISIFCCKKRESGGGLKTYPDGERPNGELLDIVTGKDKEDD
jgi:hypothetical protein